MARVLAGLAAALVAFFALSSVDVRRPSLGDRWCDTDGLAPIGWGPISGVNVPQLLNSADLVAIGETSETIVVPWHQLQAWLQVDRLIKGTLPPSGVVSLRAMPWQSWRRGPRPPQYGLFFLMGSPGEYRAVSCLHPSLTVAPAPLLNLPAHGEPLAILSAALAQALKSPTGAANLAVGGTPDVREFDRSGARTPFLEAESRYGAAVEALDSIPRQYTNTYLAQIADGNGPLYGRLWAWSALLRSGDFSQNALFSDYLRHPSPAAGVTNDRLGWVLGDTQPPQDQVQFLATAALSTSQGIRLGAIQALGGMNGAVAKKALAGALFDQDSKIRAVAVDVICESTLACDASRAQELVKPENIPRIVAIAEKWRQTSAPAVSP